MIIISRIVFTFAAKFTTMAENMTQNNADIHARQEALMHEMSKKIARRIERVLFEREMSHKDFAELVNHSQGEVSRWLHGTHNFTLSTLAAISIALDTNVLET